MITLACDGLLSIMEPFRTTMAVACLENAKNAEPSSRSLLWFVNRASGRLRANQPARFVKRVGRQTRKLRWRAGHAVVSLRGMMSIPRRTSDFLPLRMVV